MKESKLTPLQQRELIKTLEEHLLKGIPYSESVRDLSVEYKVHDFMINNYYEVARKNIISSISKDVDTIIEAHVYFYEQIYRFFEEIESTSGMLKALSYKEKLLGFHREDTFIEINNTINVDVAYETKFDFTSLSLKKQERLKELMKKTVKTDKKIVDKKSM